MGIGFGGLQSDFRLILLMQSLAYGTLPDTFLRFKYMILQ